MLRRSKFTGIDDYRKDYPDEKKRKEKRNNVFSDDVESTNTECVWGADFPHKSSADCLPKNKEDVTREQQEQLIFFTLINTTAKQDRKSSNGVDRLQKSKVE